MARAKLILTIESDRFGAVANGGGITITKSMSNDHFERLIDAYRIVYSVEGGSLISRRAGLREWFSGFLGGTRKVVKNVEKQEARKAAEAAIMDIDIND